jgi:hypothetical protein
MASGWVALGLLGASSASAGEGVIELSQACATSPTGCVPGDAQGTPVSILASGSYRLTSDLQSTASGEPVVWVLAEGVTLDLNGFTVQGIGAELGNNGSAILGVHRVAVRNGFVRNASGSGVQLGGSSRVEDLHVHGSGRDGVQIAGEGTIRNVVATSNQGNGISAGAASVIDGCTATANGGSGIALVSGTVRGSTATQNTGKGGDFSADVTFETNFFRANAGGDAVGGHASGGNICADKTCTSDGRRRYYLSANSVFGNAALSVCTPGFHMAALFELLLPGALAYATTLGYQPPVDKGSGPPSGYQGWVRTGWESTGSATPGVGNCSYWTSNSASFFGTLVNLQQNWNGSGTAIWPWVASSQSCAGGARVWCIED